MRRSEVARRGRGTYLLETMLAVARYREAACGALRKGVVAPGSATAPRSNVPVLAIVGAEDPQDPLGNLAGIRRRLPNTTTVLVSGGGHGSAGIGCVPRLMNRFLLAAAPRALDVSCARQAPSRPFVLR